MLRSVMLFAWKQILLFICAVACASSVVGTPKVFGADSDADGLLDVLDASRFDANANGTLTLTGVGIEDSRRCQPAH